MCGATKEEDGFIFSDFMGYCFSLQQKGVGGRFLSCFPLNEHFAWLERHHPGISDIKFGKTSNPERRAIVSYSKQQYEQHAYFWEQIERGKVSVCTASPKATTSPEQAGTLLTICQIKAEVMGWITQKTHDAVPGDVVNVIIECHGTRTRHALCVGSDYIYPEELREIIGKFTLGVQVNMISGACHSGAIVDLISASGQQSRHVAAAAAAASEVSTAYRSVSNRTRNSRFAQAFCQSLARIQLPGVPQEQQPVVRLGDHETWMKVMTYRNISPHHAKGKQSDTYTSYNNPDDLSQLVEAMIFREKADIVYDPAVTASRRRVEYPTINEAIVKNFRNWGPDRPYPYGNNVKQEVEQIVRKEVSKCDPDAPLGDDGGIIEELVFQKAHEPDYANVLKALYWRGRVQMAVFDVFSTLCARGLVNPDCLRQPMSFYHTTEPASSLAFLLSCYEGPQKERSVDPKPFLYHGPDFESPLIWLATMILRGCYDLKNTIETITTCRFLGDLDEEASSEWIKYGQIKDFVIDKNEMATDRIGHQEFGFWLPHGIGMVDDDAFAERLREHVNIFNRIERVFRDFFAISPEEIYLESEQTDFFERAPRKMPGWKRSGDWTAAFNFGGSASSGGSSVPEGSRSTAATSVSSPGKQG